MKKDIRDIAERFGCIIIYFFGSQADMGKRYIEGEDIKPDIFSDLDIAVVFENPPIEAMKIYGNLFKEISKALDLFSIDLVFMHDVDTLFQYEIIKGSRVYEKDERIADEFEEKIMKIAGDLSFKERILKHEIMEAIEDGYIELEYKAAA